MNVAKVSQIPLEEIEKDKVYRRVLAHGGNTMTVEVVFHEGAVGAAHTHPHEQISYCLEGEFEYFIGEEKTILQVGDSVYVPQNAVHGCSLLGKSGRLLDVFTPQREDFLK